MLLRALGSLIMFKNTIALNLIAIGKYYIVCYLLVNTTFKELYLSLNHKRNVFWLTEQNIIMAKKCGIFSPQGIESIKMEVIQIELPEMDIGRPMELKSK